jgi:hypothetical protein
MERSYRATSHNISVSYVLHKDEQHDAEVKKEDAKQSSQESAMLSAHEYCEVIQPASRSNDLHESINMLQLDKLLNDTSSTDVMQFMSCITDMIKRRSFSSTSSYVAGSEILGKGLSGAVFSANLQNDSGSTGLRIAVKSGKKKADIIHECFVGIKCTNQLRKYVPNYAYIYGYTDCSGPITVDNNVLSWCEKGNEDSMNIFCENVEGISLRNYLLTTSFESCEDPFQEFMSYYLQILYALQVGYEQYEFTHYDLHTDNVILKDVGDVYITYGDIHIRTNRIPMMIDYGFAHCKVDGTHFGTHAMKRYGIYSNKAHLMHDCYKLLVFSLQDLYGRLKEKNSKITDLYAKLTELVRFFNTSETIEQIILLQKNYYYAFPLYPDDSVTENVKIEKYIKHCLDICKKRCYKQITYVKSELEEKSKVIIGDTVYIYSSLAYKHAKPETKGPLNMVLANYSVLSVPIQNMNLNLYAKRSANSKFNLSRLELSSVFNRQAALIMDCNTKSKQILNIYHLPGDKTMLSHSKVIAQLKYYVRNYISFVKEYEEFLKYIDFTQIIAKKERITMPNELIESIEESKARYSATFNALKEALSEDVGRLTTKEPGGKLLMASFDTSFYESAYVPGANRFVLNNTHLT